MSENTQVSTFSRAELIRTLQNSLYPGARPESCAMVLDYCQAAGLNPMLKPVHIVPIWDSKANDGRGCMRDVVMPGVGHYRTQASRTGECAGVSEPEFGPDKTESIGGTMITYPAWCRVAVKRLLPNGLIAEFWALERWRENYAVKGGKEKSIAPNSMWERRPYAQLAKCTEAQALRKAFPELGAAATAEEMEGKTLNPDDVPPVAPNEQEAQLIADARGAAMAGLKAYQAFFAGLSKEGRKALAPYHDENKRAATAADAATINHDHPENEEVPL